MHKLKVPVGALQKTMNTETGFDLFLFPLQHEAS